MARIFQCGFELAAQYGFSASNASSSPTVTFPTPGRGGITGSRYRLVTINGFGGNTNVVTCVFHQDADEIYGQFVASVTGGGAGQSYGFAVQDSSGNNIVSVLAGGSHSTVWNVTFGNSSSQGATSEGYTASTWKLFEFYLKIDAAVGELTIKADGNQIYTFSGDTDPNSRPNANRLLIYGGGFQSNFWLDDVIVNDTTGGVSDSWVDNGTLLLITPNGNGDSSDMLGSDGNSTDNYLLVDDVPADGDTTYVAADAAGEKDLYEMSDLPTLPAGSVVRSVRAGVIARRADPGTPSNVDVGIKSGTTEDFAAPQALTTSYAVYYGDVHYEDPDSVGAWDETLVDALQVGAESS